VGGWDVRFFVCLFLIFLFVSVILSTMINFCFVLLLLLLLLLFLWCERTRQSYGTAKECSLHSYQVDGWMDGLMNAWMDVTKKQKPTSKGWSRSWTLVWSLFSFFVSVSCKKKKTFVCVLKFLSSCTGEKEGLLKKTLQTWRQSGTVLSLFSFIFLLKLPL